MELDLDIIFGKCYGGLYILLASLFVPASVLVKFEFIISNHISFAFGMKLAFG
jgi:hypothetical protein